MKEKYYLLSVIFFITFLSCKDKKTKIEEQRIDIGISLGAPKFYTAHYPIVSFFKDDVRVGGISDSNVGDNLGWSSSDSNQSIYGKGNYPDSIFVEWTDKLACNRYEGGLKLPSSFINSFINNKLKEKEKYNSFEFAVNFAPGGNFCVFLNDIEIKRGIANLTKIDSNCIAQNGISKISNEYYKKVGLDYSNWQKSDPRYALGLGYYTVDTTTVFGWANLISKEGVFTSNDHL